MAVSSRSVSAQRRILRTALSPMIAGFLKDPGIVEAMLSDALTLILAALSLLGLSLFGSGIANGLIAGGLQLGAAGVAATAVGLAMAGRATAAYRVDGAAGVAQATKSAAASPLRRMAAGLKGVLLQASAA